MIELGNSLRAAREAKGLTVRQLAEQTRMAPTTIQELEAENFSHIAAPIYGRGFIKLYCEAVGIDPKPFIDEFMEIFNGNRALDIRERTLPDSADTPADVQPAAVTAPEPPAPDSELDLFKQTPPATEHSAPAAPEEPPLSRYAAPIRQTRSGLNARAYLKLGVLVACALSLLLLLVGGIRAVYRASTGSAVAVDPEPKITECPPASASDKTVKRTPQKIPSLYID